MAYESYHKRKVGNRQLKPETQMMGYGYDPKLSEGALKPPVFLVKVPIPFIFGTVIVLNMLEGSLFARYSQPVKGVCSALTAGVIGTVLALGYGALSSVVTGAVASGPPAYDFEVWVASALLAVTFPFLAYYCDFFQMWPLKADRPVTPPPEGSEV